MENGLWLMEMLKKYLDDFDITLEKVRIDLIYNVKDVNVKNTSYILFMDVNDVVMPMGLGQHHYYSEANVQIDIRSSDYTNYIYLKNLIYDFMHYVHGMYKEMAVDFNVVNFQLMNVREFSDKQKRLYRCIIEAKMRKVSKGMKYQRLFYDNFEEVG